MSTKLYPRTRRRAALSTLTAMHKHLSPADVTISEGGAPYELPVDAQLTTEYISRQIDRATDVVSLKKTEKGLLTRLEQLRTLKKVVQAATDAQGTVQPDQLQLYTEIWAAAAGQAFKETLRKFLHQLKPLETQLISHANFLAEAKIKGNDLQLRNQVQVMPTDLETFLSDPEVAGKFPALEALGKVHQDAFGMLVFPGTNVEMTETVTIGGQFAGRIGAMLFVDLNDDLISQADQICGDVEGHENVVVSAATINGRRPHPNYEPGCEPIQISGAATEAGKHFFFGENSGDKCIAESIAVNTEAAAVSDAYCSRNDVFKNDFHQRMDKLPRTVHVGVTETNPITMATSISHIHNDLTASGKISVQEKLALNDLQRWLKVKGTLLLADPSKLHQIQLKARLSFVGNSESKPFTWLDLEIDDTSPDGLLAKSRGRIQVLAKVGSKSKPLSVKIQITPTRAFASAQPATGG